jgi:hypothetical protein
MTERCQCTRRDGTLRTYLAAGFEVSEQVRVAEGPRESDAPMVAVGERLAQRERPVRTSCYGHYVAVGAWPDETL